MSDEKLSPEQKAAQGLSPASKRTVAVFGGGSFGTAVGTVLARGGHDVTLLVRREHRAKIINEEHRNPDYCVNYDLPLNLKATLDPDECLKSATLIVHAIPVQSSMEYLTNVKKHIRPGVPIVSLSKGIHHESLKFMNEIIADALGPDHPAAFLSGPSFAKELMEKQPTGLVIACSDTDLGVELQHVFSSRRARVRVYSTTDVIGVEVGGALKNVYAIGAGIAHGMGFKKNTAALLVTRGLSEMRKIAAKLGAEPATLSGLSGMGDLMLTCFGGDSRNRRVGVRLGEGEALPNIIAAMREVAEGVPTTKAVVKLAKQFDLDLPLATAVRDMVHGPGGMEYLRQRLADLESMPLQEED